MDKSCYANSILKMINKIYDANFFFHFFEVLHIGTVFKTILIDTPHSTLAY